MTKPPEDVANLLERLRGAPYRIEAWNCGLYKEAADLLERQAAQLANALQHIPEMEITIPHLRAQLAEREAQRAAAFAHIDILVADISQLQVKVSERDAQLAKGMEAAERDTERLDWLDAVTKRTNERCGTIYGWKFDINHNRASLSNHNHPPLTVRTAIDDAQQALAELGGQP